MNLRTARVQGKLGLHGKTLPTKQNTPQTKTRSKGPKEHQGGRELCHAIAMEVEDAGRKFFFLGQGSGVRYLVLFGTRVLGYSRMGYVLYLFLAPTSRVQGCG